MCIIFKREGENYVDAYHYYANVYACIYYVLDMIESANTLVYSYKYTKKTCYTVTYTFNLPTWYINYDKFIVIRDNSISWREVKR